MKPDPWFNNGCFVFSILNHICYAYTAASGQGWLIPLAFALCLAEPVWLRPLIDAVVVA